MSVFNATINISPNLAHSCKHFILLAISQTVSSCHPCLSLAGDERVGSQGAYNGGTSCRADFSFTRITLPHTFSSEPRGNFTRSMPQMSVFVPRPPETPKLKQKTNSGTSVTVAEQLLIMRLMRSSYKRS